MVLAACGIAPVKTAPTKPPTYTFVDPHGRPRAYGGGVCPVFGRHAHVYPPTPRQAFVDDNGAARDTRTLLSFSGPHPWHGRTCTLPVVHQHAADDGDDVRAGDDVSGDLPAASP
jgi:hypothetical protein